MEIEHDCQRALRSGFVFGRRDFLFWLALAKSAARLLLLLL